MQFGQRAPKLGRSEILARLGFVRDLPSFPEIVARLQKELSNPDSGASAVSRIIKEDPAIATKVLKVANSVFYTQGKKIVDINDAVVRLGFHEIYSIVLTMTTIKLFKKTRNINHSQFWRHSISTAFVAKTVATAAGRKTSGFSMAAGTEAFTSGLLHDIGVLVMDQHFPEVYGDMLAAELRKGALSLNDIETEATGLSHAEVGSTILKRWGLPEPILASVGAHHSPFRKNEYEMAKYVNMADYLCNAHGIGNGTGARAPEMQEQVWKAVNLTPAELREPVEKVLKGVEDSLVLMTIS